MFFLLQLFLLTLIRYGLARYESIMMLRNELENLGRMKGANKDEKGQSCEWCLTIYDCIIKLQILRSF